MSDLHDRFTAAVQPLAELVGELDAEVLRLEKELSELRELRRNVKQVLRTLGPKPEPKPRPKAKPITQDQLSKKNRVLAHLSSAGYTPERDITAPGLKDNGLGDPPISLGMLYGILDDLRDDGFLRVDRIGKGGQKIYRTVAL